MVAVNILVFARLTGQRLGFFEGHFLGCLKVKIKVSYIT